MSLNIENMKWGSKLSDLRQGSENIPERLWSMLIWWHAIAICCLARAHPWCKSPVPHIPKVLCWIKVWRLEPILVHCHVQENYFRWSELCDIRRWEHCAHKRVDMLRNNNRLIWYSVPKDRFMVFWCFKPNSDPTNWLSQQKSRLIKRGNFLFLIYCPNVLIFLFDWSPCVVIKVQGVMRSAMLFCIPWM